MSTLHPETDWENQFITQYQSKESPLLNTGLHVEHPTRGWTTKINARQIKNGIRASTNNLGHRSPHPFLPDPSSYTILVLGDSFAFGNEVDDLYVWTELLSRKNPRYTVANLGVGGYGVDQMLVTLRETISLYHPNLVIIQFTDEDLLRTRLSFRDYRKPQFILLDNQLVLKNSPVGPREETYRELVHKRAAFHLLIPEALSFLWLGLGNFYDPQAEARRIFPLSERIFDALVDTTKQAGAEPLLAHFAHGRTLSDATLIDYGEWFLEKFLIHRPVPFFKTRPIFLKEQNHSWAQGHYLEKESNLVSSALDEKIQELESWKHYLNSKSIYP